MATFIKLTQKQRTIIKSDCFSFNKHPCSIIIYLNASRETSRGDPGRNSTTKGKPWQASLETGWVASEVDSYCSVSSSSFLFSICLILF